MRHYSELSPLEKKAREASGRMNCGDCPAYPLCKKDERFLEACDFIYLTAYKAGYNRHKKEMRIKNKK